MLSFIYDSSNWSQDLEALASEHAQLQKELSSCRCPRCDCFGVLSGTNDYYGIIYSCSCIHIFWVINPETGEKVEGVLTTLK